MYPGHCSGAFLYPHKSRGKAAAMRAVILSEGGDLDGERPHPVKFCITRLAVTRRFGAASMTKPALSYKQIKIPIIFHKIQKTPFFT